MATKMKKATRAMGMRRLLALADFLDKLPPERFDYSHWVGDDWEGDQKLSCGTTACAFGWAPSVPILARAGLRLVRGEFSGGLPVVTPTVRKRMPRQWVLNETNYSAEAAWVVFGLDDDEYEYVFHPETWHRDLPDSPCYDASAKEVARHIRRFVKWKRKQPKSAQRAA